MSNNKTKTLTQQTSAQRNTQLQTLKQWKITGKIAFITNDSRDSTSLSWQVNENNKTQHLNLTTYLGINVLQLDSKNHYHTIHVDGKTYHGTDLAELIYSLTQLTLPTKALTAWLKGLPYQESDTINYQQDTQLPLRLSSYYHNELWQITYGNYKQVDEYTLATKFTIKKDNLMIKIAVNHWDLNHG